MVEFSTLCFSPARDLSLFRNLLANQFSVRCPNEESDVAFGDVHFRRLLVCNVPRRRPVRPFVKKGGPHGSQTGAGDRVEPRASGHHSVGQQQSRRLTRALCRSAPRQSARVSRRDCCWRCGWRKRWCEEFDTIVYHAIDESKVCELPYCRLKCRVAVPVRALPENLQARTDEICRRNGALAGAKFLFS